MTLLLFLGSNNDANSLWLIKEDSTAAGGCEVGIPIKCGDLIRLEHVGTNKNLHSHLFKAPLSGFQEVSAYGEKGVGDTGDNWKVQCNTGDSIWTRGNPITFVHVDTSKALTSASSYKFTTSNCGQGCPIMGQNEVSTSSKKDSSIKWITGQGVYFPPKSGSSITEDPDDDEL